MHTHTNPFPVQPTPTSRQELPRTISKIHIPSTPTSRITRIITGLLGPRQRPRQSRRPASSWKPRICTALRLPPHTLRRPFLNPARIKRLQRQLPAWVPGAGGGSGAVKFSPGKLLARSRPGLRRIICRDSLETLDSRFSSRVRTRRHLPAYKKSYNGQSRAPDAGATCAPSLIHIHKITRRGGLPVGRQLDHRFMLQLAWLNHPLAFINSGLIKTEDQDVVQALP